MSTPLTVRLSTSRRDMHVTREVSDLQFRTVAPGGFASATIQLARPLKLTPDELAYYGRLYVYDGRNGNTVWEGRVEDLGRATGANGSEWTVNAVGPMAHAQDTTTPLIYQDVSLAGWQPYSDAPTWMEATTINTTTYGPGLQVHVPKNTVVAPGDYTAFTYAPMGLAGQHIATVAVRYGEDTTDANWLWYLQPLSGAFGFSRSFVAGSNATATLNVANHGQSVVRILLERLSGTVTVPDDLTAVSLVQIMVRSTLYSAAGVENTGTTLYTSALTASTVVADLLGRLLPRFDGANALISTAQDFTFAEMLAYPGGTTAAQVLDDLMTLLPGMYWTAGATNPATGKWSFTWLPWPTTVRYDATARDGFSSPGSAAGVYDSVAVRWADPAGLAQMTVRSLTNPILSQAGFHRQTAIDLGTPISGLTAAQQAGDQFLAQNAVPRAAATLNVARPIYDRQLGHSVMPWEIQPGYLIRVRDVQPVGNSTGDRDGTTTFRVISNSFSQSDQTAVLELDSPSPTWSNQLAALQAAQSYQARP